MTGTGHGHGLLRPSLRRILSRRTQCDNAGDSQKLASIPRHLASRDHGPISHPDQRHRCKRGIGCVATEALRRWPFRAMLARSEGANR
jgi:hypothetical protein